MADKKKSNLKSLGLKALAGGAITFSILRLMDNSGNFGISVIFEPTNLDYYRSYLPKTLNMPEKPLVAFFLMDMAVLRLKPLRVSEGGILILAERDGKLGWAEVGVPINNPMIYLFATIVMGSRKMMVQRVRLKPDGKGWNGEVKRLNQGWTLSFTPKEMSEMGELEPWQREALLAKKFLPQMTEPRYMVSKMRRRVNIYDLTCLFPADSTRLETGMARITFDPGFEWASMLESGTEAPALFIKSGVPLMREFISYVWPDEPIGTKISKIPAMLGFKVNPPKKWKSSD